jgi:hypothetical protein
MKKRDREVIEGRDRKRVGWKEKEGKRHVGEEIEGKSESILVSIPK